MRLRKEGFAPAKGGEGGACACEGEALRVRRGRFAPAKGEAFQSLTGYLGFLTGLLRLQRGALRLQRECFCACEGRALRLQSNTLL